MSKVIRLNESSGTDRNFELNGNALIELRTEQIKIKTDTFDQTRTPNLNANISVELAFGL